MNTAYTSIYNQYFNTISNSNDHLLDPYIFNYNSYKCKHGNLLYNWGYGEAFCN